MFPVAATLALLGSLAGCSSSSTGSGSSAAVSKAVISSITPTTLSAGSPSLTLTVTGTGFTSTSTVEVGTTLEPTTFVSATQLTATVPASQLTDGVELPVGVFSNGTVSATVNLEIDNPAPTVASISSTTLLAGTASAVVTVTGTGFVPSTVINVNGSARATTYINSTQVSVALPSSDLAAAGTLSITAANPGPGGGTSPVNSGTSGVITLNNPPVMVTKLTPSTLNVGSTTATVVTVTGTGFAPASVVNFAGTARPTTYVNATTITFTATVADQAKIGILPVTVTNPAPGGGTSLVLNLAIVTPPVTPVITSITPASISAGSAATSIRISGTGFTTSTVVQWNGANLPTSLISYFNGTTPTLTLLATVPQSDLATTGTATVTANTPNANPSTSNALTEAIVNPPAPTVTSLNPSSAPIGQATSVALTGTGFTTNTTVAINGQTIPSTVVSSTQITVNISGALLGTPGNQNITVTTPAPGGGTSAAQVFTTYISIPNNDIVYNSADGLIYASIPATAAGAIGNAVVGIDPNTGAITRTIQVGTNPNHLALSTDGTQLFVGIDGAASVAQINLTQGKVVNQFLLGGGTGIYNSPYTAYYLAAVPGLPNSVAVVTHDTYNTGGVTIYDSGVARTGSTVTGVPGGPLSFGSSASTLYVGSNDVDVLTVSGTGISALNKIASLNGAPSWLQYDGGALYLSNGQVLNATTGAINGTFYSSGTYTANGPIVSDSANGRAFVAVSSFLIGQNAIDVFNESDFTLVGTIPVNGLGTAGYSTNFRKIVRWGQNGLAVSGVPSSFTTKNQIFIFQSPLVKDISSTPADLSVSVTAPSTATTGTALSYAIKVTNGGPNGASGAALSTSLDSSLIINSVSASQGSCTTAATFTCDLGSLANGASATVTVNATPTNAGTLSATAVVSSSSYDATGSNNEATASTTVTGNVYGAVPAISSISPNLVQAGAAAFTLTVNGTGFNAASTVRLGGVDLTTTYVSATRLTAAVTAAQIANYGWAPVTVSTPAPGGGLSAVVPLTIYDLVNVPATSILVDPYSRSLYATIPGTATAITANSVVAINPFTGVAGTPVPVGSQPTVMAETDDGNYLYIGLSGANSLAKFNLLTGSLAATIPITYGTGTTTALSLATMPGSDTSLAIGSQNTWFQFGIFDVNGTTGAFRTNTSGTYEGQNPVFASPTELYAFDSQTSGAEFYRYRINTNGLSLIDGTTLNGMGGYGGGLQIAGGLVYGKGGGIANPNTTPPSQIQTLPLIDFYGSGDSGSAVGSFADPSLGKEFIVLENLAGTLAYGLVRYDLNSYLPESVLTLPSSLSSGFTGWTVQRFGQDGLVLFTNSTVNLNTPVTNLVLINGPFIAPQELLTQTAASLSSSSASSVTHGSGNLILTLTGSNFLPGVAVTWNGSYRTTTVVDSTHVTIAVPASDFAAAGTASVVATNPGAPASNALQITIN